MRQIQPQKYAMCMSRMILVKMCGQSVARGLLYCNNISTVEEGYTLLCAVVAVEFETAVVLRL